MAPNATGTTTTTTMTEENSGTTVPSTGFRSFWKKGGKNETPEQGAAGASQERAGKEKKNRISRLLTSTSSTSSEGREAAGKGAAQSEAQKRRQQVYQAQKRHRNRKAEYIQSLEDEIARLRHLDAGVNSEKNVLSSENQAMRELLASQSLDTRLDSLDLTGQSQGAVTQHADPFVNMRFDEQIEQDRWFVDFLESSGDMQWTSSSTSTTTTDQVQEDQMQFPASRTPVPGDSWAALDFILALEYPCKDHVHHPIINPDAWTPGEGNPHGHGMTATAAVFAGAQPPQSQSSAAPDSAGLNPHAARHWHLPHDEIDKLIALSASLSLDDTEFTPAQAYSAVREAVPNEAYLRPTLDGLKQPLAKLVHCAHFGSTLDTGLFWGHFDAVVEGLKFTRPELGG